MSQDDFRKLVRQEWGEERNLLIIQIDRNIYGGFME
jgi:hypothetical protein